MKFFTSILMLTSLLFSYEKGDLISNDISTHLNLKADKVYVINFFASWCRSCKKELPLVSKVNSQINKDQIEIIGIDVDKDVNKGIAFQKHLKENGKLNFRIINDPQSLIISEFNPKGMPTLFYIKNNKVLKVTTGAVPDIDENILLSLKGMCK
ncbi:MAG TPA: TlpA family protein disulfide reductase [Sulfurimonas sp.]|nr:TlpA family protein disulfide reductase [Sulfurimonas sp.]